MPQVPIGLFPPTREWGGGDCSIDPQIVTGESL